MSRYRIVQSRGSVETAGLRVLEGEQSDALLRSYGLHGSAVLIPSAEGSRPFSVWDEEEAERFGTEVRERLEKRSVDEASAPPDVTVF